jgi:hypothetical protein
VRKVPSYSFLRPDKPDQQRRSHAAHSMILPGVRCYWKTLSATTCLCPYPDRACPQAGARQAWRRPGKGPQCLTSWIVRQDTLPSRSQDPRAIGSRLVACGQMRRPCAE